MNENPEDQENHLREVVKTHKGKNPTTGLVAKWVKANKINGLLEDTDQGVLERRVKAQWMLEKYKLIDCKKLINAALPMKFTLENKAKEERDLFKEIFHENMVESQEMSTKLEELNQEIENELILSDKKRPVQREMVETRPVPIMTKFSDPTVINFNDCYQVYQTQEDKRPYEIEKLERALFRSPAKEGQLTPRSPANHLSFYDNKNSFSTRLHYALGPTPYKDLRPDIAEEDESKMIFGKVEELEKMVIDEIDVSEERTQMIDLLSDFKALLKRYKENSSLQHLKVKLKSDQKRREELSQQNGLLKSSRYHPETNRHATSIKKLHLDNFSNHSYSKTQSEAEIYVQRDPLQTLNSNRGLGQQFQRGHQVSRVLSNAHLSSLQQPRSIDVSVLRNHNFSVDVISAFQ